MIWLSPVESLWSALRMAAVSIPLGTLGKNSEICKGSAVVLHHQSKKMSLKLAREKNKNL